MLRRLATASKLPGDDMWLHQATDWMGSRAGTLGQVQLLFMAAEDSSAAEAQVMRKVKCSGGS
ncbi:hypothetical protein C0Q70_08636 [Pomacea canaliculata]|uniref:Uncharacterized protein n=1 Tax=Pomacea canaliculata TaxID=400727 RepID=A0A2T7P7I0_POMCA|nr:hypothetical protein C0Q70_08636 [Pomacea canaliculata]